MGECTTPVERVLRAQLGKQLTMFEVALEAKLSDDSDLLVEGVAEWGKTRCLV